MPTIDPPMSALLLLDLPVLMDMLIDQTNEYSRLVKSERWTHRTAVARETLIRTQAAIEHKMTSGTLPVQLRSTTSGLVQTEDRSSLQPKPAATQS